MNLKLHLRRCFLILGFLISHCYAQDFRFEQLSQDNILDKQPVLSIAQDQKGKLWFGGVDNLFVYDSKNIVNILKSDTTLKDITYITKIGINVKNDLFIATSTHLHIYDINKQLPVKKNHVPFKAKIVVLDIQTLSDQTFLCAQDGLYLANTSGSSYNIDLLVARNKVHTISQIGQDTYVIASLEGIEVVKIKNKKLSLLSNLQLPISLQKEHIISSFFYEKDNLWVGSKLHGIYRYDFKSKKWWNLHVGNSNLLSNNVRKIIKDPAGNILIGTLKGLSVFQKENKFDNYQHHTFNYSLSQNSIYDIFVDNQKIIWLGTYFGGLNAIYPNRIPISIYSTRSKASQLLNSDITSSFTQTKDAYWVGTEEKGINIINKESGNSTAVPQLTKSNLIKDLYVRGSKIYAAQYAGGYSVIDFRTYKSEHFYLDKDTFNVKNNVFTVYVDPSQKIYLGTNVGLYTVEKNQVAIQVQGTKSEKVTDIQEDSHHKIYFLQGNKLYAKDHTHVFNVIPQLKSYSVQGFSIDQFDQLWFTTDHALYCIQKDGIADLAVEFKQNNLGWPININNVIWITSKNGLIFFNPKTKYSTILNQNDGLPVKNLQSTKLFQGENGELFLTTLNGLLAIDTKKITFNHIVPSVLLRNIFINEHTLPFERIDTTIANNHYQINLRHNENYITIDFSSSNFIKPLKNKYRYKLEGTDKYWVESNSGIIKYTNLPEGRHRLTILSCNNDMIWSETPLILDITILPPFWLTWWAYLFYAALLAITIHYIIKFIVERKILINSKKEHEKKIKFFTQVSHEIRTPLTLITAPLDELITEVASLPKTQYKIIRIKKNSNKLLSVINELLDFKKFDENKQDLKLTAVSFREYMEDTFYLFNDLAQTKNLNYYIKHIDSIGIQLIDTIQFDKVMFNLLSNAIKYTPEKGTVYLEIIHDNSHITIHIVDNGIGINAANQFKIFEEYYREEQVSDTIGTGIGLALSKKIIEQHGGEIHCQSVSRQEELWTIFTVQLPLTSHLQYSESESSEKSNYPHPSSSLIIENTFQATLLIVEDNKELLEMIASIFKESFNIILAKNGEEALIKAEKNVPDLIISDLMMPNMNGIELCKAIKSNIITSHIPFILLTAITDNNVQTETLQSGANIYLTKPFNNSDLFYSVQNLLSINKKRSRNFQIKTEITDNEQDNKFIQSLNKLIEDHLLSDFFDVNYISSAMGMSAPVLYRKLNAITNLSLNNYVKNYRLNKAKDLLRTSMNISEVAYAVGFSDRKYFSKEFKKLFGQNPSEYINTV